MNIHTDFEASETASKTSASTSVKSTESDDTVNFDRVVKIAIDIIEKTDKTPHYSAILPPALCTLIDIGIFHKSCGDAYRLIKSADDVVSATTTSTTIEPRTLRIMCVALHRIVVCYRDFWFTVQEQTKLEEPYLESDLTRSLMTISEACSLVHATAMVALVTYQTLIARRDLAYTGVLTAMQTTLPPVAGYPAVAALVKDVRTIMDIAAAAIPTLSEQNLVFSNRPILEYTMDDILWINAALARRWRDTEYTEGVKAFTILMNLRFGMLISESEELTAETKDVISKYYSAPVAAPLGVVAPPTPCYVCTSHSRRLCAARMDVYTRIAWLHDKYPTVALCALKKDVLTTCISNLTARKVPRNFDFQPVFNDIQLFNPLESSIKLLRLLVRFCKESAMDEPIRKMYRRMFFANATCPGDMQEFDVTVLFASKTKSNGVLINRGGRFFRELNRISLSAKIEDQLRSVQKKLEWRMETQHPPDLPLPFEQRLVYSEDVAVKCAMEILMQNKYGVSWEQEYVVVPENVSNHLRRGVVAHNSIIDRQPKALNRLLECSTPRLFTVHRELRVLMNGKMFQPITTPEAIATWIYAIKMVTNSVLYISQDIVSDNPDEAASKKRSFSETSNNDKITVLDLCAAITGNPDLYEIRGIGLKETSFKIAANSQDGVPLPPRIIGL